MPLDDDKILGSQVDEYAASVGKTPADYEQVGLHASGQADVFGTPRGKFQDPMKKLFLPKVPDGAEAVVEYRFQVQVIEVERSSSHTPSHRMLYVASGVALVPK